MSLTPAPDDVVRSRHRLAAEVLKALIAAGVPAHIATSEQPIAPGATIEVDQFADAAGGVFVNWTAGHDLLDRCVTPLLAREFDDPAIRLNGRIAQTMAEALQIVLEASGFNIEDPDDEYRPMTLKVSGEH